MNDLNESISFLIWLLKTRKKEGSRNEMMRDNEKLEKLIIEFMEEVIDTFEIIQRSIGESIEEREAEWNVLFVKLN